MAADLIPSLRAASRKLVREWGFLRPTLAGTTLSHAAVHCLIELSDHSPRSFSDLATELRVSPSDLRPVVAELLTSDSITLMPDDKKQDHYSLTPAGLELLNEVNAFAQNQVAKALQVAHPTFGTDITTALGLYAAALETARLNEANPTPQHTPISSPLRPPSPPQPTIKIVTGYIPGLLGRTLEMHATYYSALVGWGQKFEADLGTGISDLIRRLDNPLNQAWSVVRTTPYNHPKERIEGVIFVDGEKQGEEGVARIRAFILDESVRGLGLGKRLVEEAMRFVRETGFRECRLQTMRILTPAIRLYEREGFVEVGEEWETHWGGGHMALHFTWWRERDLGGGDGGR